MLPGFGHIFLWELIKAFFLGQCIFQILGALSLPWSNKKAIFFPAGKEETFAQWTMNQSTREFLEEVHGIVRSFEGTFGRILRNLEELSGIESIKNLRTFSWFLQGTKTRKKPHCVLTDFFCCKPITFRLSEKKLSLK